MRNRVFVFFIFVFFTCILCASHSYAQTRSKTDSLLQARKHSLDSIRSAQKHMLDSMKLARMHSSDSIKTSRKRVSDSLATIRNYKSSKHYTDSVARSRQKKIDNLRAARKTSLDSLKASRKKSIDSVILTRKTSLDKIKAVQKKHTDSVMVVRKYKESKRYKDSVTLSRTLKLNAIRKARKKTNDSMLAIRKQQIDLMKATRKRYSDSVARVQKKYIDSLKAVRKVRTDSLAKIKLAREKMQKALEKKKADKMNLALSIKIQKKREAWSNESMLKKRWVMPRKGLQNLYTHYNYYYNAKRRMKEAEDNMQRSKKDNFDSLLALYPFDPNTDSSLMKSDMDSVIQKTSIGIQIHDPRTKWADDLYLLLGQAFYYKGDYTNASTSFKYIISMKAEEDRRKAKGKHGSSTAHKKTGANSSIVEEEDNKIWDILKHKSVHNEAILWLAHTYTEQGQINNAESVLELVESDPKFPENLKGQLALEKAFLYIHQNNYPLAATQLVIAKESPDLPDWIRRRASFMNGQILLQQGDYTVAADNFRKVIDMNPKIDMDFYARKYLANSLMLAGIGQDAATASLKKMLNDGKYLPYYEQVYYVLGGLCASTNNTEDAIDYYGKSIKAPKTTKKQKALSFAGLGNVYFNIGEYANAKKAYDSAAYLASHAAGDPSIATAIKRSRALSEITGPATTIHVQDSMLYLASLSEKEQKAAARKYINSLQKKKNDSAFKATNVAVANNQMSDVVDIDVTTWYFSTPATMQQGYSEFKRKWGTRPLADNWRRMAALNTGSTDTASALLASDDTDAELDENGLPTESALIAMLPKTEEKQKVCFDRIQRAYIDLGAAYIKQLEEYNRATATFDTLDRRFMTHKYKAEELYYRYEIALKQNNIPLAQTYSAQLMADHPKSSWAARVKPTEDGEGINASKVEAGLYYQETYDLLMMRQYTEAIQHVNYAKDQYPDTKYKTHYKLIEATAYAGSGEYDTADSLMVKYAGSNPPDSLRKWADAVLQFIAKNRPKNTAAPAVVKDTTMIAQASKVAKPEDKVPALPTPAPNVTKAPDTSAAAKANGYTYESHEEHYFLFSFTAIDSRANTLRNSIAEMNTQKFKGQPLVAGVEMLQGSNGFVIVRSFQNAAQGKFYLQNIETNPTLYSMYKAGEYKLLLISVSNYQKLLNNHSIDSYITFYNANYK